MSIDIGPKPNRDEEFCYEQQRKRRSAPQNEMSQLGAVAAVFGIAVAFVAFVVIRNAVIEFWNTLPF